ncbi:hypothetical protein Q73A0000_03210 [Kaistella flava (ex Peng et al. 2021)]|uniref:Uncharacterized protein n=1 Tax=Kaistella flava (ex Peng et al. 2021) TaxID=2038776 RepID=A0A7M2Y5R1_9FLAO|nr:hypothetical protein [Kaistella flava (ex Peng et al. 2021)]QOW09440.1 hypothetical protein Q73A0000_03210 [Kaistella flava (ex Peng et al. 2021)]
MKNKIPTQQIGAESEAISKIIFETEELARVHFETVKKRFLDINSWELFAGEHKAEFSLRDEKGNLILDHPKVGNYVSIKIPLLHNPDDDGFDWVKIEVYEEAKEEHYEAVYIRVRPTSNPKNSSDEITHFLNPTATSNFFIRRNGKEISAEVYARNETPNSKDKSLSEKIRNKIVSVGGMLIGSKIQWEGLTDGLIKHEK